MELFSSVENTGAFTLCFMRSFRRRIAVGPLAGALPLGWRTTAWLAHYRLADALLLGWRIAAWLAHYCLAGALLLGWRIAAWTGAL